LSCQNRQRNKSKKFMTISKKRIGILLTDPIAEAKKDELISLRRRNPPRPWLKNIDFDAYPDFKIEREAYKLKHFDQEVPRTVGIATDVSIGAWLKVYCGETFEVDYIQPKEISKARLAQNDINFLIIYDLLESFHIDRTRGKRVYHTFLDAVRCSNNTFPNWELQEFVGSKLLYYNHFKSVGIPIAPTHTLTREEFTAEVAAETAASGGEGASDRVTAKILSIIQRENWGKFIAKPVLGQESKAFKIFNPRTANLQKIFAKYVVATITKYPGLIFQKFMPGFGKTIDEPEIRMYWVGQEYQFSMIASPSKVCCLSGEGHKPPRRKQNGLMRLPKSASLETLKSIGRRVMEVLQSKITLMSPDGDLLPLLMTRVDLGIMQNGEFKPWVNEVEFVPSYYLEDHTHPIDATVAKQCAIIAKKFLGINNNIFNSSDNVTSKAICSPESINIEKPALINNPISLNKSNIEDSSTSQSNAQVLAPPEEYKSMDFDIP